jgi:hypothetical protein
VNTVRVAQISSALEQGTYKVDSQQIADRLVQSDKELANLGNQHLSDTDPDADAD